MAGLESGTDVRETDGRLSRPGFASWRGFLCKEIKNKDPLTKKEGVSDSRESGFCYLL